jgi:hypothetical protein
MRMLVVALGVFAVAVRADEPTVASGPVKVVDGKAYAEAAAKGLSALGDPLDPKVLDRFIATYPESEEARFAFAVRMSFVRASPVIATHHAFLAAYPDRVGSRIVLGDLFRLYRRADRLSGYLDFLRRYPGAPEAQLARLHVHRLAFELACRLGTAADFDAFTLLFPDAAQRDAAEALAEEQAIAEERALYAEQAKALDGAALGDWINRRLRNMVFVHRDLWVATTQAEPPRQVMRFIENDVLGRPVDALDGTMRRYLASRVARIYAVVRSIEAYRLHEASDQILAETRHQELIAKLDEIRAELEKQRQENARLLAEEFARTRETLRAGFEAVVREQRLNRALLAEGFTALADGMDRLHADLVAVHGELLGVRYALADIDAGIRKSNALLGRLDARLAAVNENLYRINVDLNRGLDRVATGIERMHEDMNRNFDRQADISLRQLEVAQVSLDVQAETLYTVDRGF